MITEKESSRFFREHRVDFAVAGGGMAGVCCAITAARLGLKTILIQNRPVLGGPSGSECDCDADGRIVGGASQYGNRNAKETGILEELRLEAAYRYQHGWRNHWSILLREWCEKEQSLKLLLNTEVTGVKTEGNRIVSLSARTLGSELNHIVHAPLFADCTGDAFIGCEAGAEFRMGREARAEFGESLAPEVSDNVVLGSSIFFRAVDVGHPVKFVPPEGACRFEDEDSLCYRVHRDISKGYYWIECGAEHDTIADNEAIYRKLLSILYGVWDHIKNHGDHGAENYAINWISNVAGKRESRRLTGDYMMCEKDIVKHTEYPDAAAYGGWNLDLHPVKGIFSREPPSGPPNAIMCPGVYQIPFRSLYSGKIDNLMMAGRNISASHVALSSTRVMGTCAVCGQAVGAAAFLMTHHSPGARRGTALSSVSHGSYHPRNSQRRPVEPDGNSSCRSRQRHAAAHLRSDGNAAAHWKLPEYTGSSILPQLGRFSGKRIFSAGKHRNRTGKNSCGTGPPGKLRRYFLRNPRCGSRQHNSSRNS